MPATSNSAIRTTRPSAIEISFPLSNDRQAARYVSATIVREEALQYGRLIGLYWSATGYVQRENMTADMPGLDPTRYPVHVFELEIDGQSLHNRWDWIGASERDGLRPGTVEAVVELRHQVRPVTVKVVTRLDGTAVLARWLEITNTGDAPAALSHLAPWSGELWNTDPALNPAVDRHALISPYTLGYLSSEDEGTEGHFSWHPLPRERYRIERPISRTMGSPYFIVRNEITGECCFIAPEISGPYVAEFNNHDAQLLTFRIGPLGHGPLRVIDPGETVRSPEIHLGMFHCGIDDAIHEWHRHMRASVVPPRPEGKEMYTLAGRVVEYPGEWILREIDIAAEMGVEAFMVDAGWYGDTFDDWWKARGDWHEGDWLPGKMAGVRQYIHDKGMLFGIWQEPETTGPKSNALRDHPEWMQTTDGDRILPLSAEGALNLAIPEVAKHFEDSILHVIRDFEVDFYKIDYNINVREGGQTPRDGYLEHEAWRHQEVLHRVFDRVQREFPQVALESCSGGGGRNDIGMLSRFHYCCESDWSTLPLSIRAINGLTMFIPPEAICYYHNHIHYAHQVADIEAHLRVTLFATPIFVGFGAQDGDRSTLFYQRTRRYIEIAKTFCRPVIANRPMVYHHTPSIGVMSPADWCVLEYGAQDRSRGYAAAFRMSATGDNEYVLRLRGVDASHRYDVRLDNSDQHFRATGMELILAGIRIHLDTPLTSELVLYEAV